MSKTLKMIFSVNKTIYRFDKTAYPVDEMTNRSDGIFLKINQVN